MKAYKGTDKDMKCRDYQFELGKTETIDGDIKCCERGFHSCEAPFDVLRYYPNKNGNRFFEVEIGGKVEKNNDNDTKFASSKVTLKAELNFASLVKAQVKYTRKKAKSGTAGGYRSNLAGGDRSNLACGDSSNLAGGDSSNLAGGDRSNLAGGYWSNLAGGDWSNLACGDSSNLAGGDSSNLAGGDRSNLAGGDRSNLAGGDWSNLAGGDRSNLACGDSSNLAGGDWSNLACGDSSVIVGRNGSKAKAGLNSVIVLTQWELIDKNYIPVCCKSGIVDGKTLKPDTWYKLENGEFVEVESGENDNS